MLLAVEENTLQKMAALSQQDTQKDELINKIEKLEEVRYYNIVTL